MRNSLTFATISGIPLKVQLNWFFIAGLVAWSLSVGYFPLRHPGWESSNYWMVGLVTSVLFFASVLVHELGHAVVAMQEGIRVRSITLFIFGGVAHIDSEPPTAESDFRIVVAGPFSSLVLAAVFEVFGLAVANPYISAAAAYLASMNLILAAFNMIPGFPLDGGRVLRAIFWKLTSNFRRATLWATLSGYLIAVLFVVAGVFLAVQINLFSGLWMGFIGIYLGITARHSYRQSVQYDPTIALQPEDAPQLPVYVPNLPRQSNAYGATFLPPGIGTLKAEDTIPLKRLRLDTPSTLNDSSEGPY